MRLEDECILSYYKVIAKINENHRVYLVQHVETHKIYVKKILKVFNPEVFHVLKREHVKNTPRIYEVIHDTNELIIIEEYINGTTLQEMLDANHLFTEEEVIKIVGKVCVILQQLHHFQPSIVHRDIKPSNIMITNDGEVKLLDMNAAKLCLSGSNKDTVLIGTVGYAAPEQYGFASSNIQTDIYSLGILINMLMTNHLPQERIVEGRLKKIVQCCTKMDPTQRYKSIDEVIHALKFSPEYHDEKDIKQKWKYAPIGFRTGKIKNMILASFVYILLIWFMFTVEIEGSSSLINLWMYRIGYTIMFLLIIFFWNDYLGIHRVIGLRNIQNKYLYYCTKVLYSFGIFLAVIILLVILESTFTF